MVIRYYAFLVALCLDRWPSCFIELSTLKSDGEMIQRDFSNLLVTFCSSFKYLRLYERDVPAVKPENPDIKPCVSLTLLFSKSAPANAKRFREMLNEKDSPWLSYQPPDFVRVPFEELFLLKNHSAPLLGFIPNNHVAGVRISLIFSSKKDEMVEFYRIVTGRVPVLHDGKAGTIFIIYPIATHLELQLIFNPTIHANTLRNGVVLCVRIRDHEKISLALRQPLKCIDTGFWETFDPVGNNIRLFTPFE